MGGCPAGISYLPCGPDRSGDFTVFDGKLYGVIGTSASSPDFAGLLALREEYVPGRIGNVNYIVYKLAQEQFQGAAANPYFHTGVPGFNGYYHTHAGYNYVLGNGTVYGKNFIDAPDLPSAGDPLTPSNP
jgi:subtilase family serine protease